MSREAAAIYSRNCFVASAIVVAKCECGCQKTKILFLDKQDRVRATATTEPDLLVEMAIKAKTDDPMRLEKPH